MRTNNQMRNDTLYNIREFFNTGMKALTVPQWDGELLGYLKEYKKSPYIHEAFYHGILATASFSIQYKGAHILNVDTKLPLNIYARTTEANHWNSAHIRVTVLSEKGSEEMLRYCTTVHSMREAEKALAAGAQTALTELTVERALERLPEIKAFLPRGYKI